MGCVQTCSGFWLVTLNTIFLLVALAIGGLGGFLKFAKAEVLVEPLVKSIESLISNEEAKKEIGNFITQIFEFLRPYGLALFIVGITLVIITCLAICGVCCQSKCLLITYSFIVFIFLAGMLTLTIFSFIKKDTLKDAGGNQLRNFVTKDYVGPTNSSNYISSGVSLVLDLVQVKYKCCGVTNYTDFDDAQKWKDRTFVVSSNGYTQVFNLTIPPSCCKFSEKDMNITDPTCLSSPNAVNSNMYTPCYSTLWEFVDQYWDKVRYGLIGVTAFVLLLFLAALCAMRFDKEKIDPI